jgi:hypothetical protein
VNGGAEEGEHAGDDQRSVHAAGHSRKIAG